MTKTIVQEKNAVTNKEINRKENKLIYLEIMRIVACFFVLFNHTGTWGHTLFQTSEINSLEYWIYLFISIFCKFSVPLFLMISGALLLPKEKESLREVWKKRIFKILLILVIWSFLYYLYEVFLGNERFNLLTFFSKLYYDYWNFSYWYIYCYIGFLICIPFLRVLVNNLENKYFYYMYGIAIVTLSIIPTLQYILVNDKYAINWALNMGWLTTNFVLFPCIGYFLEYRVQINKKLVIGALIINLITLIISCQLSYLKTIRDCYNGGEYFHQTFVLINSSTIYITIKYIFTKLNLSEKTNKIIISIGSCTLGIYLMHIFFMRKFNFFVKIFATLGNIIREKMLTAFAFCIFVMGICYIITLLLKKIPFIKKIV